jgi:D-amino-acid dehydrogenase
MTTSLPGYLPPKRALIVGAGMVGLSCAWSLQGYGIEVRVVDRKYPGAGASWQNAGYVSPGLCAPLTEPAILRYGIRAVLNPRSPVQLLWRGDPRLAGFMAGMARHCTARQWRAAMAAYRRLNEQVEGSYESQLAGGVHGQLTTADVLTCFATENASAGLVHEIQGIVSTGQRVKIELLTSDEVREREPHVSAAVGLGVLVKDQKYLTPAAYVQALTRSVRDRGGQILEDVPIRSIDRQGSGLVARGLGAGAGDGQERGGPDLEADVVVVATGAWLSALARNMG